MSNEAPKLVSGAGQVITDNGAISSLFIIKKLLHVVGFMSR